MNPIKKLAGQTAIYGLSYIVGRVLNYFLTPYYSWVYETDQYGIVSEMYAYVGFFIVIFTYGMETSFFRFSSKADDPDRVYSTAFMSVLGTSTLLALTLVLFSQPIVNLLAYPEHPEFIIYLGLILALDAIAAIPFAKLRKDNRADKYATVKVINILINIGFNLFFLTPLLLENDQQVGLYRMLNYSYDPEIGVGYVFISNLIASAVTLLLLLPVILNIKFDFDKKLWRKMLIYGYPIAIASIAGIVNEMVDRILLKIFLPGTLEERLSQMGIYSACYKLSMLMTISVQAFKYAAEPFFFSHAENKDAPKIYASVLVYFTIFGCLIFLGVSFFLDVIILILRENYREAKNIVPVLLLANLFLGIFYNLSVWYKIRDKTRYGAVISIGGAIITILLNITLIPIIGYWGSAWATLICYGSMMIISYFWGKKHYFVPYNVRKIGFYLALALAFYSLSWLVDPDGISKYVFNSILLLAFAGIAFVIEKPKKVVT